MKIFTNGCWDILSPAHYNLLNLCRDIADDNSCFFSGHVLVAIDSDRKIKEDKGKYRPIYSFEQRRDNLLSLKSLNSSLIDEVVQFDTNEELYKIIVDYSPDQIVKGSDWTNNVVGSDLAKVIYYERDKRYSSTDIIGKIIHKYKDVKNFQEECMTRLVREGEKLNLYKDEF